MNITLVTTKQDMLYVRDGAGTLARRTPLTLTEKNALFGSPNMVAPGCTREEWDTQGSVVAGGQLVEGGVWERINGSIRIIIARDVVGGQLVESIVQFEPGEWTGTLPAVSVTAAVIATMIQGSRYTVLALQNGVLTVSGPL